MAKPLNIAAGSPATAQRQAAMELKGCKPVNKSEIYKRGIFGISLRRVAVAQEASAISSGAARLCVLVPGGGTPRSRVMCRR